MIEVTLFSTLGCHLCDLALAQLEQIKQQRDITITITEIGDDDHLVERYGIKIPVLKIADKPELNWPFEQQDILQLIDK